MNVFSNILLSLVYLAWGMGHGAWSKIENHTTKSLPSSEGALETTDLSTKKFKVVQKLVSSLFR